MKKKLLLLLTLVWSVLCYPQDCPNLISPTNGSLQVVVETNIIWEPVVGVQAYIISLGTTPGGTDIVDSFNVGSDTSYQPPLGLPENTEIFVTLTLFFFDREDVICESQSFTTETILEAPLCSDVVFPINGAINVSPETNIVWEYGYKASGYILNIGTTLGGGEIVNDLDVGNQLNFRPATDLPPETRIYVSVTPYNSIGQATFCSTFTFITSLPTSLPGCTNLISPLNGATNVPLTPLIEWNAVTGANGYRVTIGSSPTNSDVLDNTTFTTTSTLVLDFEPNNTFFVTIIPFNDAGDAIGCQQEAFSTQLGCGPHFDPATGELVTLNPEFEFSNTFSFCENQTPLIIDGPEDADGYRWFKVNEFRDDELLSETSTVEISENGDYYLEAYTLVLGSGEPLECPTTKMFSVVSSEQPVISNVRMVESVSGLNFTIETANNGNFEFAIDDSNGPYQDSNVFTNIEPGNHVFYVRDKGGCGVDEWIFEQDLTVEGFPKFFTPNGDTANDFWQYVNPPNEEEVVFPQILIFNRYGKLLREISSTSKGWDGRFNGQPLPAGEFWFRAIDEQNKVYQGHFTLKR
ncbi:T9SS type B sorting domain-containing protein [Croceivirga lutea]|uniref:T9SS type B sorting domain-containing protein n=1 Tax=Croceivirga lutea TaxID=1775167 RepID=UPI00163A29F0|nr:T9SS type B sorting domain-containing protein [Croceivirga lutea]